MSKLMKLLSYSCLLLLVIPSVTAAEAENSPLEVGRNSAVKGIVEIQSQTDLQARKAIVKEPVLLGDNVNSRIGSSLQVLLKDNSTFTVGPQCEMTIDKFVYDPTKDNNSISAKVKKGMFRFTSGKVSKTNPDNIIVTTPTATMGIRGTIVEVLVGPEAFLCAEKEGLLDNDIMMDHAGATLVILRGPGPNTSSVNRRGEVDITSGGVTTKLTEVGTGVLVSNVNEKPSEPFVISTDLFNYFNRRLRTQPTRLGNFKPFVIEDEWFTPIPKYDEKIEFISPMDSVQDMDWPSQSNDIDIQIEPDFERDVDVEN